MLPLRPSNDVPAVDVIQTETSRGFFVELIPARSRKRDHPATRFVRTRNDHEERPTRAANHKSLAGRAGQVHPVVPRARATPSFGITYCYRNRKIVQV